MHHNYYMSAYATWFRLNLRFIDHISTILIV